MYGMQPWLDLGRMNVGLGFESYVKKMVNREVVRGVDAELLGLHMKYVCICRHVVFNL